MPAYIDSAFTVRKPAWWDVNRNHVYDRPPSDWDEARRWAGLDWEPEERPLLVPAPGGRYRIEDRHPDIDRSHLEQWTRIGAANVAPGSKAICRSDTGALLGVVGNDYPVIGHDRMGRIVEALLEREDIVYQTAGAVRGGRQVWALAHVDQPYEVNGYNTPIVPYLALLTDHTGAGALKAIRTTVTIVCWNTWQAAESQADRSGAAFSFAHRGTPDTIDAQIEAARDVVMATRRATEQWCRRAKHLRSVKLDDTQERDWLDEFCLPDDPTQYSDRVIVNCHRTRARIAEIVAGPTVDGAGIRGTALGLTCAAGEYLDHYRKTRSQASYISRTMLKPEPLKARAEQLAVTAAGVDWQRWSGQVDADIAEMVTS